MTSQTYSLIPTSAFAPFPTPSDSNDGNNISDLFSSKGSPGLVVAFIALGLFAVTITSIFWWRRFTRSRHQEDQLFRDRTRSWLDRPVLWDVRTHAPSIGPSSWEHLAPLTANVALVEPPPPPDLGRATRRWAAGVRRFYLRPLPPPPTEASLLDVRGDASLVRVSVLVAMPGRRGEDPGTVLSEFGMGTVEVPWSEDTV